MGEGCSISPVRDSQLHLLWTARVDYADGNRVARHRHDDYDQLLVVLSGAGEIELEEKGYAVKPGHAYLMQAGRAHAFRFASETITLDFKFRLIDPSLGALLRSVAPVCACAGGDLMELKRWYKLSLEQAGRAPLFPIRIEAGLKGTLVSMLLSPGGPAMDADAAFGLAEEDHPLVRYVKVHYASELSLERLAKQFNFHSNYMIKLFKDVTGMTPIHYVQELRLAKAKEYLEFTSLPVADIAERVGWSLPYLSRLMKSRIGQTPTRYRSSLVRAIGRDIAIEPDFANVWRIER